MTTDTTTPDFLEDMLQRGLVQDCTDREELRQHLATGTRKAYVGFDPTADSLTIGNLVGVMALARFQIAGHHPVALMGGGTGLIGDPSGKSAERILLDEDSVRANVYSIEESLANVWDASAREAEHAKVKAYPLTTVNNIDWLGKLGYLEALRDIGKYFSVNQMIARDSVKDRLHNREQGISYTEFSYMILQAYDYAHLHKSEGVTLQMGGSDQWGNIVSGADLIRRFRMQSVAEAVERVNLAEGLPPNTPNAALIPFEDAAFGLTWPLITKADGGKFGKSESGAVWLSAHRTSPYAYSQFWLNAADADVERFLKVFTFIPVPEITAIMARHGANPGAREAQRALAQHATDILHGTAARQHAEAAASALFSGDVGQLPLATLLEVLSSAPSTNHDKSQLAGEGLSLIDLLAQSSLAKSKTEARQFLTDGSVSINGVKAAFADRLTLDHLLHNEIITLRRGKKNWHVTRWE